MIVIAAFGRLANMWSLQEIPDQLLNTMNNKHFYILKWLLPTLV